MSPKDLLKVHLVALFFALLAFCLLAFSHLVLFGQVAATKWEVHNFLRCAANEGTVIWFVLSHLGLWIGLISMHKDLKTHWRFRHIWLFLSGAILSSLFFSLSVVYWWTTLDAMRVDHVSKMLKWGGEPVAYWFDTFGIALIAIGLILLIGLISLALARLQNFGRRSAIFSYAVVFWISMSVGLGVLVEW